MENAFPHIITELPRADIPIEGLDAYLLQGINQQVVFMCFENEVEVPEHTHEAQWGVVLEGEIALTINGIMKIFRKGDAYVIPKNVSHSARIKARYKDVSLFNKKDRYKTRKEEP